MITMDVYRLVAEKCGITSRYLNTINSNYYKLLMYMKINDLSIFLDQQLPEKSFIDDNIEASTSYIHVTNSIPTTIPNKAFVSIDRLLPLKVYSLGFQPAKTIPEIPHWFFQKYTSKGAVILEPFAGSGTSIIEALKLSRNVIWLDYHPLSQLTCKVKTTRLSLAEVADEYSKITKDLDFIYC